MNAIHLWRLRCACCLFIACALTLAAAERGRADDSTADWESSSRVCKPACRSGYECKHGECTPSCTPSCGEGFVCSAEAGCVRAQPSARDVPWSAPETSSLTCAPSCRSGYACISGRCVSACNPVCAEEETCTENGECVAPAQIAAASVEREDRIKRSLRDSSADSLVNLHLDLAGALQFGATGTLEVGENLSGYLQLRVMNTGLASYYLLVGEHDRLRLGLGAALGVHWFSATRGNMRGVYGGLAIEYAYVESRDTSVDFVRFRMHALIPQIDFGYRWAFGELFVGIAGKLGLAIPLAMQADPIGDNGCRNKAACVTDLSVVLFPGLVLDVGWFIPR